MYTKSISNMDYLDVERLRDSQIRELEGMSNKVKSVASEMVLREEEYEDSSEYYEESLITEKIESMSYWAVICAVAAIFIAIFLPMFG